MQRIACYSTVVMISLAGLAGCSSGWSFADWRDALTFNKPSSAPTTSVSEMQQRALQLERVQEYETAAEVYAEILKQDHDNQLARQRLTAIQRYKHALPARQPFGAPRRNSLPVSRETELRQSQHRRLPQINPGPAGTGRSIATRGHSSDRATGLQQLAQEQPGRASLSMPPWARSTPMKDPMVQKSKHRVPLDEFMQPAGENKTAHASHQKDVPPADVVKLPAVYDAQSIRRARGLSSQTNISQVSMTATLPEIAQPDDSAASQELSLIDVQKRLSTHPADPSAIETLVQAIRTENRIGRWEISSTLGVLIQHPDSKSLMIDSLSRALTDTDPEMRRNTALVIASLGRNAQDLLPVLEQRLRDREESVRAAAAYAVDEIR